MAWYLCEASDYFMGIPYTFKVEATSKAEALEKAKCHPVLKIHDVKRDSIRVVKKLQKRG